MFVQKVPHIKDQFLTQERASMELESGQIAVGWYTNEQDSQSVVHSHPYYELVLPLVGSNVRYSVDGNIYDINLGEMIIFPARCYHAGMFNITDKISERLIAQIERRAMAGSPAGQRAGCPHLAGAAGDPGCRRRHRMGSTRLI